MNVKYTGTSDFQEFSAADFKKAGVEGKKTSFPQGESVEVDDSVGQALIAKDGIFGDFSFEEVNDEEEQADDSGSNGSDAEDAAEGSAMTDSGSLQQDLDTPSTPRTAKKATSARTR